MAYVQCCLGRADGMGWGVSDLAVVLVGNRRNWNSLGALAGALEIDPHGSWEKRARQARQMIEFLAGLEGRGSHL